MKSSSGKAREARQIRQFKSGYGTSDRSTEQRILERLSRAEEKQAGQIKQWNVRQVKLRKNNLRSIKLRNN